MDGGGGAADGAVNQGDGTGPELVPASPSPLSEVWDDFSPLLRVLKAM